MRPGSSVCCARSSISAITRRPSERSEEAVMGGTVLGEWAGRKIRGSRGLETRRPGTCRAALSRDSELLLKACRGGRVLEQQLLLRIDVAVHFLRRERTLVEAREDQLQLARIGVDVADREDAGHVG